jgi:hypothetical protein
MNRPKRDQTGYVLPVVLYLLAAIAVGVTAASGVFLRVADRLSYGAAETQFQIDAMTLEARAAHLLATEPLRQGGLEIGGQRISRNVAFMGDAPRIPPPPVLRGAAMPFGGLGSDGYGRLLDFDGRAYDARIGPSGARRYRVAMQDVAGLLDVNRLSEEEVVGFLGAYGVSPLQARRLAATLRDFLDADDDVSFGGAERAAYRREGLRDPPNARVIARSGLFGALGWGDPAISGARLAMLGYLWAAGDEEPVRMNVNTASATALSAAFGLDARAAERAVAEREEAWFTSLDDFSTRVGAPAPGDSFSIYSFPARSVRLVIQDVSRVEALESVLVIAPAGADRPVFVKRLREYVYGQPADAAQAETAGQLPSASSLLSR